MTTAQKLVGFLGVLPRTAERLLPEMAAQEAENINMLSGEIKPVRQTATAHIPAISGEKLAAFRAESKGVEKWRTWPGDVDVARGALDADAEPRYYWTGDGEPRYATFSAFGTTDLALGIPGPVTKPGVAASGGSLSNIDRAYCYTFVSALYEESGPSPVSTITTGKPDGTWAISAMDAFPTSSGSANGVHSAGVTTLTNTGSHWLRAGDEIVIGGNLVAVSAITSPAIFKVPGNFAGSISWARKAAWNTTGMFRRLYRSAGTMASWQLVADGSLETVGTTYSDTKTDTVIPGDELISNGWQPPPPGLRGIITLPNGANVGFIGSEVRYSEPNQPHAWPDLYRFRMESGVVGLSSFGSTVVAATETRAHVGDGVDPSSVTFESAGQVWPCLSKRSVVSLGDGVLYATTNGLAYLGTSGASLWTQGHYTKEEWAPLNPSSMVLAVCEAKVFVLCKPADGASFMMVFSPSEPISLVRYSLQANELYTDPLNGALYLVAKTVDKFDAGTGSRMAFNWLSKEFELPAPINPGVLLIDYSGELAPADQEAANDAYSAAVLANQVIINSTFGIGSLGEDSFGEIPIGGSHIVPPSQPEDYLCYTLYSRARAVHTLLVVPGKVHKLPRGYKTDVISHRLTGNVRVKTVKIAETIDGLKLV